MVGGRKRPRKPGPYQVITIGAGTERHFGSIGAPQICITIILSLSLSRLSVFINIAMLPLDEVWESSFDSSDSSTECESIEETVGFLSTIWEESTCGEGSFAGGHHSPYGPLDESIRGSERSWTEDFYCDGYDTSIHDSLDGNAALNRSNSSLRPLSDDEYTFATMESDYIDNLVPVRRWSSDDTFATLPSDDGDSIDSSSCDPIHHNPTEIVAAHENTNKSITNNNIDLDQTPRTCCRRKASIDLDQTPIASGHKRVVELESNGLTNLASSYSINTNSSDSDLDASDRSKSKSSRTEPPHVPVRKLSMEFNVEMGNYAPFTRRMSGLQTDMIAPSPPIRKQSMGYTYSDHGTGPYSVPQNEDDKDREEGNDPSSSSGGGGSSRHLIQSISIPHLDDDEPADVHAAIEGHLLKRVSKSSSSSSPTTTSNSRKIRYDLARCILSPKMERMAISRRDEQVGGGPRHEGEMSYSPDSSSESHHRASNTRMMLERSNSYKDPKRIRIRNMKVNNSVPAAVLACPLSDDDLVFKKDLSQHTVATDLSSSERSFQPGSTSTHLSSSSNPRRIFMTGALEYNKSYSDPSLGSMDNNHKGGITTTTIPLPPKAPSHNNFRSPKQILAKGLRKSKRKLMKLFRTGESP
eukprot:scaffold23626_cov142-Cylindrotheca_fusiformis.AAC.1